MEKHNITLEKLTEDHAKKLFNILKEKSLYEFIPEYPPNNLEELEERFRRLSQGAPKDIEEVWLNYAIYDNFLRNYVGTVQATIYQKSNIAELAYFLGATYQGMGLMTYTLNCFQQKLIKDYNIKTFKAFIDTRNIKSISLIKRLGFVCSQFIENADTFKGSKSDEYVFILNIG